MATGGGALSQTGEDEILDGLGRGAGLFGDVSDAGQNSSSYRNSTAYGVASMSLSALRIRPCTRSDFCFIQDSPFAHGRRDERLRHAAALMYFGRRVDDDLDLGGQIRQGGVDVGRALVPRLARLLDYEQVEPARCA